MHNSHKKTLETIFFILFRTLRTHTNDSTLAEDISWAIREEFKHYPRITLLNYMTKYFERKENGKNKNFQDEKAKIQNFILASSCC